MDMVQEYARLSVKHTLVQDALKFAVKALRDGGKAHFIVADVKVTYGMNQPEAEAIVLTAVRIEEE